MDGKRKILIGLTLVNLIIIQAIGIFNHAMTVKADPNNDNYNHASWEDSYVYDVIYWGGEEPAVIRWEGFDWGTCHGYANSSNGGKIVVNYTAFYDKHPNDWGLFESPLPYLNISFYEKIGENLILNSTFNNFSTSETGMIMGLGFNQFLAGFFIPVHNFTWLTQQARAQDSGLYSNSEVYVEEYLTMIRFDFLLGDDPILLSQNTSLIYDKTTGVLVWARVEMEGGAADFEIKLSGYTFDWRRIPNDNYDHASWEESYVYNVSFWGGEEPAIIRWEGFDWGTCHGYANSSNGGKIVVNYTAFYDKHPNDWGLFESPLPYLNISFYERIGENLILNSTFNNFSTSETSMIMGLGFNQFLAGFFIPVHNFVWLTQQARAQDSGWYSNSEVYVNEDEDMIRFDFLLGDDPSLLSQNTSLIYNKTTGVLIWAKIEIEGGAADFEIILDDYNGSLIPSEQLILEWRQAAFARAFNRTFQKAFEKAFERAFQKAFEKAFENTQINAFGNGTAVESLIKDSDNVTSHNNREANASSIFNIISIIWIVVLTLQGYSTKKNIIITKKKLNLGV
ncbi:MAG: hypothetical protein ACTSXH_03650 [Promethearchaeota archaeon]